MIVIAVLPLIVGAIAAAIITVLQQQPVALSRVTQSVDAQLVSANFVRDVQSAALVTTDSKLMTCGTAATGAVPLLGLEWTGGGGSKTTTVSYVVLTSGSGSLLAHQLFREVCNTSGSIVSARLVASDVPSTQGPAAVTCAATVSSCTPQSSWIQAAGISSVNLAVQAPGAAGSYFYSLVAQPQAWSPSSGGTYSGGAAITPFIVLPPTSGSCPIPTGQSSPVYISGTAKVVSGSGLAPVTDGCPGDSSITLAESSASVQASEVLSADCPNPDSVTLKGNPTGPPEQCTTVSNPLAALNSLVPTNPTASAAGACTVNGTSYVCPTGEYATTPSFPNTASIQFGTGAAGSVFIFDAAVTIQRSMSVVFEPGTYWFKAGLTVEGNASATLDNGTYLFGKSTTSASTDTISVTNGAKLATGAGGVLLYLEGGSANFSGNGSVTALGEPQYYGVVLWDNVAAGSIVQIANSGSTAATFGGVYVPYGETIVSGSGQVTMSFVATQTGNFGGSGTLTLG